MKVVLSSPLGQQSQETGLIYLLANYMVAASTDLITLRCNGAFSVCDRDSENNWHRTIDTCITCAKEQRDLGDWAGTLVHDLSTYLPAQDVERTKRWVTTTPWMDLTQAMIDDACPFDLCRHLFAQRFGQSGPTETNRQHEQFIRRIVLAAARMTVAARRFLFAQRPDLVFISGARDFITASLGQEARRMGLQTVLFRWNMDHRAIEIHHPRGDRIMQCELVTSGVTQMRNDARTWPVEVIAALDDILEFIGVPRDAMPIPVAK